MPGPRSVRSLGGGGGGAAAAAAAAGLRPPSSPTLSATTHASLDFPCAPHLLITRADLRSSLAAYERLLAASKAYTAAMQRMAGASADLACALEECARVKGAHDAGPGLQAASGLHFLMGNYGQVLADAFWKDFSIPLLSHFDTYRAACAERQLAHEKAVAEKSRALREAEARNLKTGRRKERDLQSFRRALAELQAQVDGLDELKGQYYHEVLESEEEVWEFILSKVSLIVRSQLEISERISSKGLSDPVLEPMLSAIPDPFDSYGPPKQDDQIFSILPPTSLLSAATSAAGAGTSGNAAGEYSQRSEALGSAIVLGLSGPSTTSGEAGDATTAASGALFGDAGDDVLDPSAPNGSVAGGLSRANEMSAGSGALDSRGEGAAGRLKKVLSIIDEDSAGLRVDTPAQRPEAEEVAEEQSEGVDGDEKSPTEQSEETTHANDLPTTSNADLPNGTEEAPSDTATNDVETANRSAAPPFDPVAHHEEAEAVEGDEGGDAADDPQAGEEGRSGRQEADASSLADETR